MSYIYIFPKNHHNVSYQSHEEWKRGYGAVSPVQNAPSHGQQSVVHSQGVIHTSAGLNDKRGHGQSDERTRDSGELYVATHAAPGGEDI